MWLAPRLQARAGPRVTWWRRLRLDDTCLPELAAVMPLPGLDSFIGTLYMRYGEEPIPQTDLIGWQKVGALGSTAIRRNAMACPHWAELCFPLVCLGLGWGR